MKIPHITGAAVGAFFKKSLGFITAVSKDPRIPLRDKAVLAGLIALVISPLDIIPDFIPLVGQLDDLVIMAVILDYLFNRIPEEVLLSHFPWDPARLTTWRRRMGFLALLIPDWARRNIWRIKDGEMGT